MTVEAGRRVLLADDDADVRLYIQVTLEQAGFAVTTVPDGQALVDEARRRRHDIVLLDVQMPVMDGLAATRTLRDDPRTSDVPIILVTARARGADKVVGLEQGADDYVTKPFDADELVARINAALRRSTSMRQVSPLSGLPGNTRIEAELNRRIVAGAPFSLLYCDLNRFKAYNDSYGFLEGDRVLRAFADLLVRSAQRITPHDNFVGHVGGDDYVVITGHDDPEGLAAAICRAFDEAAPGFYDDEARELGWIEVEDRRGHREKVGHVSVDIGIVSMQEGEASHVGELVARATEMKHVAKMNAVGTSTYAIDRRSLDGP